MADRGDFITRAKHSLEHYALGFGLAVSIFGLYIAFLASGLDSEYLNAALIAILVIITAIYAQATQDIVSETRKDRRAKFLMTALMNFYSPLINNPAFWKIHHNEFAGYLNQSPGSESADGRRAKEFLDTINKYSHLAGKELEVHLYRFQVVIRSGAVNLEPKDRDVDEKYNEFKAEFEKALKREYEKTKRKLEAL